jgi:hypothetical protein
VGQWGGSFTLKRASDIKWVLSMARYSWVPVATKRQSEHPEWLCEYFLSP